MRFNNRTCLKFIQTVCILAQLMGIVVFADDGSKSLRLNLTKPAEFTIQGPLQKLVVEGKADYEKNGKKSKFFIEGQLVLKTSNEIISLPVDLSLRGQSSVLAMDFPKYKIKFTGEDHPLLAPLNNLKVVSHGWEADSDKLVGQGEGIRATPLGVYREAAVYDLLREAGLPIAQTRRAKITYKYSDLDKTMEQPALLIETYKALGERLGGAEIPLAEMTLDVFKKVAKSVWAARITFAEMMIGNWDFSLPTQQDLEVGTHNVTLIRMKSGVIVPYIEDFNMASMVSLNTGVIENEEAGSKESLAALEESPLFKNMLSNLSDLKDEFSTQEIKNTVQYFAKKKEALLKKVETLEVDEKGRTNIRNHLFAFFEIIEKRL